MKCGTLDDSIFDISEDTIRKYAEGYTMDMERCEIFHPTFRDIQDAYVKGYKDALTKIKHKILN